MEPLICDIPYPKKETLPRDVRSGWILSFAYATAKGELSAMLQYRYHALRMRRHDNKKADVLSAIAEAESLHLKIVGEAMEQLGVDTVYTVYPNTARWFDTGCVSRATTPEKIIMDDIRTEMESIAEYKKMLFVLKNEQVEALVERLILDEELHLEALKTMLRG